MRASELDGANALLSADNAALRRQQGDTRALDDLIQPVRDSLESLRQAADRSSRDRTEAEATLTTQIAAVQEQLRIAGYEGGQPLP